MSVSICFLFLVGETSGAVGKLIIPVSLANSSSVMFLSYLCTVIVGVCGSLYTFLFVCCLTALLSVMARPLARLEN